MIFLVWCRLLSCRITFGKLAMEPTFSTNVE
jgi:hypothetical protein